ncbi:MAG: 3-deoxy-7-phosphoheptulonate synthase [Mariprofundaceae bacterium]|nr:3-deoxy-7-phosphoheptulonate synthase [Mariprofundaceae bacterium]
MSVPYKTDDLRITGIKEVVKPEQVHAELPVTEAASRTVFGARSDTHRILQGEDDRLLVVVGPCSVHDVNAALEYAERLKGVRQQYADSLHIVMRIYFEKPRTRVGWKGLINDPYLNHTFEINDGIRMARKLLLDVSDRGVPAGTEFLDLITPQYVADLVSWGAIGARTTESQGHRELASGLSCPMGFKNGTDGGFRVAVDAIRAAEQGHHFLSLTKDGRSAIFSTAGNDDCHLILRGGSSAPNYSREHVQVALADLAEAQVKTGIMIDCSHANSNKNFRRQPEVARDVAQQISVGNKGIMGLMIESHLNEGQQSVGSIDTLAYGVSVTDACVGWADTLTMLEMLAESVAQRRQQ